MWLLQKLNRLFFIRKIDTYLCHHHKQVDIFRIKALLMVKYCAFFHSHLAYTYHLVPISFRFIVCLFVYMHALY